MYIILSPYSVTNPSRNYRVVDNAAWLKHVNGGGQYVYPVEAECKEYGEAENKRDELNAAITAAPATPETT